MLTKEKQIADWLNGTSGEPAARKRVIQLVRDVRALAAAERMRFQIPSPEGFKWAKEAGLSGETPLPVLMRELKRRGTGLMDAFGPRMFDGQAAARLDAMLARFRYRPYCNLVLSEGAGKSRKSRDSLSGRLILHMIPTGWNPPEPTVNDVSRGVWPTTKVIGTAPSEVQEAFMIQFLAGVAGTGNIDRIRECQCGKWFVAERTDKRHCTDACRAKFKTLTEEQKKQRRIYHRDYQRLRRGETPSRRNNPKANETAKVSAKKGGK